MARVWLHHKLRICIGGRPWATLCVLVLAGLFAATVYRAATQSLTHDEARLWYLYLRGSFQTVLRYFEPGHHFLFTVLAWVSTHFFGSSELFIRLPTLIAGAWFLVTTQRLAYHLCGNSPISLVACIALAANPLVMDFFVAARGYGLALAAFAWAWFQLYLWAETDQKPDRLFKAGVGLSLAVGSNLSLLFPSLAAVLAFLPVVLLPVSCASQRPRWRDALLVLGPPVVLGTLFVAFTPVEANTAHYYDGAPSLLASFERLAEISARHNEGLRELNGRLPFRWVVYAFFALVLPFAMPTAATIGLTTLRKGQRSRSGPWLAGGTACLALALWVASHGVLGVPYPSDRSALWLVFLGTLCVISVLRSVPRGLRSLLLGVTAIVAVTYTLQFNTRFFYNWRYDAETHLAVRVLDAIRPSGRPLDLGFSWPLAPSLAYYRERRKLEWLPDISPLDRTGPYGEHECYLVTAWEANALAIRNVQTHWRGPLSGVSVGCWGVAGSLQQAAGRLNDHRQRLGAVHLTQAFRVMGVILPVLCFLFLVHLLWKLGQQGLRACLLGGGLTMAVLCVAAVELLSLVRGLSGSSFAGFWSATAIALALISKRARKRRDAGSPGLGASSSFAWARPLLGGACLIIGTVLAVAVLCPPNMVDSQIYHMPRILLWLQQGSVRHFPTTSHQQLFQPPWAEFAALHLYALWGGDRLVNLVQLVSMLGSALVASLIAERLGARVPGQVLAAVLVLTLPQGLLAASSLKNDWPTALWVSSAAYFVLLYEKSSDRRTAVAIGLAAGLALLTKGTAYVFVPSVVACCMLSIRRDSRLSLIRRLPLVLAVAVVLNFGHYYRNWRVYGSPLGCDTAECGTATKVFRFANADFSLRTLWSNAVRNLALHLITPAPELNQAAHRTITHLLQRTGVDPNDPANTWPFARFAAPSFSLYEGTAGNPLHLLFYVLAGVVVLSLPRAKRPERLAYGLAAALGFIGFCWLFRWQPWHTRLHLPLFVVMAPWTARIAESRLRPSALRALAVFLLVQAAPFATANELRPLLGPSKLLPASILELPRRQLYRPPDGADLLVHALRQQSCRDIAIDAPGNYAFYPLLDWLNVSEREFRVTVLSSDPRLARLYGPKPLRPCAVIFANCSTSSAREAECQALGPTARYGDHRLVTSFDADWVPAKGWQNRARMPRLVTLEPKQTTVGRQVLSLRLRDSDGAATISTVLLVINSFIGAEGGCFLRYSGADRTFWLLTDDGRTWQGPLSPSAPGFIQNSRCKLHGAKSQPIYEGDSLIIQWDLTFEPGWPHRCGIFAHAQDTTGLNSGWAELGEWLPH